MGDLADAVVKAAPQAGCSAECLSTSDTIEFTDRVIVLADNVAYETPDALLEFRYFALIANHA